MNNLQYLMVEIYGVLNCIGPSFIQKIFIRAPVTYNLRVNDRFFFFFFYIRENKSYIDTP